MALLGAAFAVASVQAPAHAAGSDDVPRGARANEPSAEELWTLERATKLAVERAPEVQLARAMLSAAKAYRTFGTMPRVGNPVLSLRAMVGRPDSPAATYSALVGLPFDVSGRRPAYRREAKFIVREAEARVAVVENEARSEGRDAFIATALSGELLRVASDNSSIAQEFLARVQARFDAKAATALDVSLSQRDYAESVANMASAQAELAEARGRLRQALDLPPTASIETAPLEPPLLPQNLTLQRAVELAQQQRRDANVHHAGEERLRAAEKRLRREAIAPLVLSGEVEAQGNQNTQSTGGVGANWELPVLLRNQGERAVARKDADVQRLHAELTERRVGREAVAAYQQLEATLAEFYALEREATPAAERALAMTMEMLEAGAIDYFRLLNAREMAFGLRARRVEALRLAWQRRIVLERAMGGLTGAP